MVVAASSIDDVFVIVVFSSLLGLYTGGQVNVPWKLAGIPLSILTGILPRGWRSAGSLPAVPALQSARHEAAAGHPGRGHRAGRGGAARRGGSCRSRRCWR
jgi:hypothetical protein